MRSPRVKASTSAHRQLTVTEPEKSESPRPSKDTQAPTSADPGHGLVSLLEIEREAREADNLSDLQYIIANQTPKLTAARQAFVFQSRARSKMHLVAVSGLASIDRTVPLVHTLERLCTRFPSDKKNPDPKPFNTASLPSEFDELKNTYPFHAMLWLPFKSRNSEVFAGILLTRERQWSEADTIVASRLAGAFQHSWAALIAKPNYKNLRPTKRLAPWLFASACLLALAVPVPMTTLAPMEIVPAEPFIVAAPIDGVVKNIEIEPNAIVKNGDLLVKFENTTVKNQLELAEREVLVANARLKRATQLAFSDERGRHDLGIARAELSLKTAERDYARDLASNSQIKAERKGVAIFSGKKELLGKPLAVGERIMQIADPDRVKVRIEIPVGDSLILDVGAHVSLYLDSSPLEPVAATVIQANFEAAKTSSETLSYKVTATIDDTDRQPPRLGVRGTAQIFGDKVSLGFYLFRKPISALRQWVGV